MVVMMLMVVIMAAAVMVVIMLVMMVLMFIVVIVVMRMVMFEVVIVMMLVLVVMVMPADGTGILLQQCGKLVGQRVAALHGLQDLSARQLIPRGGDDRRGRVLLADKRQNRLSTTAPA